MSRSPRTMVFAVSIVTTVPFFIRTDDISNSLRHKKGHRRHKMHKKHKEEGSFLCLMCFLWLTSWRPLRLLVLLPHEPEDRVSSSRRDQSCAVFPDSLATQLLHFRGPDRVVRLCKRTRRHSSPPLFEPPRGRGDHLHAKCLRHT